MNKWEKINRAMTNVMEMIKTAVMWYTKWNANINENYGTTDTGGSIVVPLTLVVPW